MKTAETICKVCGEHYPAKQRKCPKCGCPKGGNKPAYLRCKRCGIVFTSRREKCPGCGQRITPQTAAGVLLPPGEAARRRRTIVHWCIAVVVLLLILITEGFLVKSIYANIAYRESLQLWNCGGSVEANRRAPDPIYEEPVAPEASDSLTDSAAAATHHAADSIAAAKADSTFFEE